MRTAEVLLLVATAVHAGFQLVVTLVVYPAFADAPEETWTEHHAAHARRIGPVVGVVYGALLVAAMTVLSSRVSVWTALALVASGAVFLLTALVAVPAHRALSPVREPAALRRLLLADRLRLLTALVAAAAALVAAV